MSNETWKKRYTFRLTEDDKDIFDFVQSSKSSESETIRKLLKVAIQVIDDERNKRESIEEYKNIKHELEQIKTHQDKAFQDILEKLDSGIVMKDAEHTPEQAKEEKKDDGEKESVEKSIDSLLDSFG